VDVGILLGNAVGNLFQDGGLAGLGRRDNEPTLAAPDGNNQVDQAGSQDVAVSLQVKALIGEYRGLVFKTGAVARLFGVYPVDAFHLDEAPVLFGFARRAHVTDHKVTRTHFITPQLRLRDVDIVFADGVARRAQEANALAHDFEDAAAHLHALLGGFRLADAQDEGLFFQAVCVRHVEFLAHSAQFGKRFVFKFENVHHVLCWYGFG